MGVWIWPEPKRKREREILVNRRQEGGKRRAHQKREQRGCQSPEAEAPAVGEDHLIVASMGLKLNCGSRSDTLCLPIRSVYCSLSCRQILDVVDVQCVAAWN